MKKIEKQLKKEIREINVDDAVLDDIKNACNMPKPKNKAFRLCKILVPALSAFAVVLTLCLTLTNRDNVSLKSYLLMAFGGVTMASAEMSGEEEGSPAFEIVLSDGEKVESVKSLNERGAVVLAGQSIDENLDGTITNLVLEANDINYLNNITVIGFDGNMALQERISTTLQNIVNTNNIACDVNVRFNENKVDNVNENHYILAEYAQAKNGGDIADYVGKGIDELLKILFDYNEESLNNIQAHIERYIEFVNEQTSTITGLYNEIADATTTFLERVDDLIDSYEQGSDLAELQYDALVEQLTIFVNQFSTYFGDISTGQMDEYLQQDKIENFYNHFQSGYNNIVSQLEEAEKSAQNKIDIFKEDFNVNNFAMVA